MSDFQAAVQKSQQKRKCVYVSPESICQDSGMSKKLCQKQIEDGVQNGLLKKRKRLVALKNADLPVLVAEGSKTGTWVGHQNQIGCFVATRTKNADIVFSNQTYIQECFDLKHRHCVVDGCFIDFERKRAYVDGTVLRISWYPPPIFTPNDLKTFVDVNAPPPLRIRYHPDFTRAQPKNPRALHAKLVFHGTPTYRNAQSIVMNGFDPTRRQRQMYGKGEYFSSDCREAMRYGMYVVVTEITGGQNYGSTIVCSNTRKEVPRAILVYK